MPRTTLHGRQGLTQKASQPFFGNTSVQQNIIKAKVIVFSILSDLQKLPIYPYICLVLMHYTAKLRGHLMLKQYLGIHNASLQMPTDISRIPG